MKLLRHGEKGSEKPGMLDADGNIRDLSGHVADIDGSTLGADALAKLAAIDPSGLPLVSGSPRLGVPVANPSKILCIGLNYSDHAIEAGQPIPDEPVLFMKSTTSLNGPNDKVVLPRGSVRATWTNPRLWITWRAIRWSTTFPSVSTSSRARGSGSRVRAPTPSVRWVPGW